MAKKNNSTTANLGFEEKLWAAADKLRGHMDPSEYKHTVLGLIFLKYISDRFSAHREKLQTEMADPDSMLYIKEEKARYLTLEDRDEYTAENVFWVPPEARWGTLQDHDLIFTTGIGTPVDKYNLLKSFKKLLRNAGLPEIRFHDLRHTAASLMLNHGIPVIVVSRRLGHSRPSITLDIYGHLIPGKQKEVAILMDELLTPIQVQIEV